MFDCRVVPCDTDKLLRGSYAIWLQPRHFEQAHPLHFQRNKINSKSERFIMINHTVANHTDLRSCLLKLPLSNNARQLRLRVMNCIVACTFIALATTAVAQKPDAEPTLLPGSAVNLAAITNADWIQGEGPTAFEPGNIYVFECWATWCPPCVALIPHVNELHKKYYDKGLRVHGMNSWEDDREKVVKYVKAKGEGMSYPVAYTKKSAFETEWLDAAGVQAIPHAFVVRNGKLLLATEAVRLTDSLIELMLSGDEGAAQAAAKIKAAYDARGKTDKLSQEIYSAKRAKDAEKMAAKIKEVETLDPDHPDLSVWKLQLLIVREQWEAAIAAFNEMPQSNSKNSFVLQTGMRLPRSKVGDHPMSFVKAFTDPYAEYLNNGGDKIGPNHFANLTTLYWRLGDKENAIASAENGVKAAINHKTGASEHRTNAFKRFAKSVKEGTLPEFSELSSWQIEARKKAEADKNK